MAQSLFSTYKQGENRVTSTFLAVLRQLSLQNLEFLLGSMLEEPTFELVLFRNQISTGGAGTPDGEISSSCHLLFETKIARGTSSEQQIERHLKRLNSAAPGVRGLILLTPDYERPKFTNLAESSFAWCSFTRLSQLIDQMIASPELVVGEKENYLLRELQAFFRQEGLLQLPPNTVVVAARTAWDEYLRVGAYICQADRKFAPVKYIAFYAEREIKPKVAKIKGGPLTVVLADDGNYDRQINEIIRKVLIEGTRIPGQTYQLFELSEADDPDTVQLEGAIRNDLRDRAGEPTAFTMGQRYVSLDSLIQVASLGSDERLTSRLA